MSNETTENFLRTMSQFEWPDVAPVSYRLYYTDTGAPKFYTMEDLPGKYIEVDRETYVLASWNVQVVEGKLHIIKPDVQVKKLRPDCAAGMPCHIQDVCVTVSPDQPHIKWNTKINEIR
jgi:hypothetical protein